MTLLSVDPRTYELAAFAQLRGLRGVAAEWSRIISVAQAVIARSEDTPRDEVAALRAANAIDALASCRSLDSCRQEQSRLDEPDRLLLSLEAAVAYAMTGNFTAAQTVARHLEERAANSDPDLRARYACVLAAVGADSPIIGELLRTVGARISASERLFMEAIVTLLSKGGEEALQGALDRWRQVVLDSTDDTHKSSLLRGVRVVLYQMADLSVQNILRPYRDILPNGYIDSLCNSGLRLLLPSQEMALAVPAFLNSRSNVLISMPTSTGKTLLGQLCMCAALGKENGLSCYVAPYQALANQVYRVFRRQLPGSIQVERAIGGYSPIEPVSPEDRAVVIVATPERFDAMIRNNQALLAQLRCVVIDEAHMIEQPERGVRLEGLLARLRLLQQRTSMPKLVLLSAALSHQDRIEQWLSIPSELSIKTSWRPTASRLALWRQPGILEYYYATDVLRPEAFRENDTVADLNLRWPHAYLQPPSNYGALRAQKSDSFGNIAHLCATLLQEFDQPILCVCSTRASTRELASGLKSVLSPVTLKEKTMRLISELEANWPHLRLLRLCLENGIAYHNSSLPSQIRELIEEAAQSAELRVITATTTLAEGINLPFRFTVLVDWLAWTGDHRQEPLSPLLFRNIAGRCGRAGSFTEGDTIVYDNPLGDLIYTRHDRPARIVGCLIAPARVEVRGPLEDLARGVTLSDPERVRRISLLASQYLACISENPDEEDLSGQYCRNLYSSQPDSEGRILGAVTSIENGLLTGEELALASRSSPLRLTAFGKACMTTGLSPDTCRLLAERATSLNLPQEAALPDLLASVLTCCSDVAEATGTKLDQVFRSNSRFPVKSHDLGQVIRSWLVGDRMDRIFAQLPFVLRSTKLPKIGEWLQGVSEPTARDEDFDKFYDFVSQVLQSFLPWMCRALGVLQQFFDCSLVRREWSIYADYLEYGVDTGWAVSAMAGRCPVPRTVVAPVGRAIHELSGPAASDHVIPLDVSGDAFGYWLSTVTQKAIADPLLIERPSQGEINQMESWLVDRRPPASVE